MFKVGIITASDKCSRGEREDQSGLVIKELLNVADYKVIKYVVIPDEIDLLAAEMIDMSDRLKVDLIITTGGTGLSPRDWTPEATLRVIERQVPGIVEAIRSNSLKITPKAMLSRGVAGIRGRTLIINLPGSPKAVQESLEFILPALRHGLEILTGLANECANEKR